MTKAHICWAKRTASRVFVRRTSVARAKGPAAVAAMVAACGIANRLRNTGTANDATSAVTAAPRIRERSGERPRGVDGAEARKGAASIRRAS